MHTAQIAQDKPPSGSRKHQITHTVLDLVAKHGAEEVSAQLIADAIGVSQPAIFRHFATKEAIWLSVMDWLEDRLTSIYQDAGVNGSEPGVVILTQMFHGHIALIERHPALAKLVFADHLRSAYPAVQRRFAKMHKGYWRRLVQLIDQAKAEGDIPSAMPSEDAATMFLCVIQGLAFQFAIARVPMKLPRAADHVFCLYLRAISA